MQTDKLDQIHQTMDHSLAQTIELDQIMHQRMVQTIELDQIMHQTMDQRTDQTMDQIMHKMTTFHTEKIAPKEQSSNENDCPFMPKAVQTDGKISTKSSSEPNINIESDAKAAIYFEIAKMLSEYSKTIVFCRENIRTKEGIQSPPYTRLLINVEYGLDSLAKLAGSLNNKS